MGVRSWRERTESKAAMILFLRNEYIDKYVVHGTNERKTRSQGEIFPICAWLVRFCFNVFYIFEAHEVQIDLWFVFAFSV